MADKLPPGTFELKGGTDVYLNATPRRGGGEDLPPGAFEMPELNYQDPTLTKIPGARYVAPMVGAGVGAVKGAALGAPAGPVGMAFGGLVGAAAGGLFGGATNEALEATHRLMTGKPQRPFEDQLGAVLGEGEGALYGQAIGTAAAPVVGRLAATVTGYATAAREALVRTAHNWGIDLTAAQQTGANIFKNLEAAIMRVPGGAGVMQAFGSRQASQLAAGVEHLSEAASGRAAVDAGTRSSLFVEALEHRMAAAKRQATVLFDRYMAAAGPDSLVDPTPLVRFAQVMRGRVPEGALGNGRLRSILDDIIAWGERPKTWAEFAETQGAIAGAGGVQGRPAGALPLSPMELARGAAPGTPVPGGGRPVTLAEIRNIRTALGEFAYPGKLATTQEVPIGQARQLYGVLTGMLKEDAARKGPGVTALLENFNQFERAVIHGQLSGTWYAQLLKHDKDLGSMSRRLFDPKAAGEPNSMLLSALAVLNREGWQMIQQQYFDDVITQTQKRTMHEGAWNVFDGRAFADRILRPGEDKVLRILFTPEQVESIREFAKVASAAQPTSMLRDRAFTSFWTMLGASGGAGLGVGALTNPTAGAVTAGTLTASSFASWALAKALTDPTAAKMLILGARAGTPTSEALGAVSRHLIRSGAIAVSEPVPVDLSGYQR